MNKRTENSETRN